MRDDADDLLAGDHGDMMEAAVRHQPERIDRQIGRRHGGRVGRHDLRQGRLDGILAIGEHAANRVSPGENARQVIEGMLATSTILGTPAKGGCAPRSTA